MKKKKGRENRMKWKNKSVNTRNKTFEEKINRQASRGGGDGSKRM